MVISDESDKKSTNNYQMEIIWKNVIIILLIHIFGFYGFYLIITDAHYLTILFMFIVGNFCSFGVQCGAHRLWCHRGYKAKAPLKLLLICMNTMAGQTPVYDWSRDHRVHHKFSETDADPHNSNRGFFFAHCGWLMCRKHPDVKEKGKSVDISDLEKDPFVTFQKRYYIPMLLIFFAFIPAFIPIYFWNESINTSIFALIFLRYALVLNVTWSVNSAAHLWGMRPYNKYINPAECVIRHLMYGEGYHNYHHVYAWDYSASEFGCLTTFNPATAFIDFFYWIGWAYELRKPSENVIKKQMEKFGSHEKAFHSRIYELTTGTVFYLFWPLLFFSIRFIRSKFINYFTYNS